MSGACDGDTSNDFIVAFMTTNLSAAKLPSAVTIDRSHPAWKQTGLKAPSVSIRSNLGLSFQLLSRTSIMRSVWAQMSESMP